MSGLIEQDIWTWITDYIEQDHEFYGHRFPPCPYARRARLQGELAVKVWHKGSIHGFIDHEIQTLNLDQPQVLIMVFPPWLRWSWLTRRRIDRLNRDLVTKDRYIQMGTAVNTRSRYALWPGSYVVVIVNVLSRIMEAHHSLLRSDYYANWSRSHYRNVVGRRQEIWDQITAKQKNALD
jgi:hypothetical protein